MINNSTTKELWIIDKNYLNTNNYTKRYTTMEIGDRTLKIAGFNIFHKYQKFLPLGQMCKQSLGHFLWKFVNNDRE